MHLCRPIRGPRLSLTTCGMCRSAHDSRNSRSFCTCKITSLLHIPHALKVPQFQRFAQKSRLTPVVCADTRTRGEGVSPAEHQCRNPLTGSHCVFSRLHTPNLQPACFQRITNSGGGGGGTGTLPAVHSPLYEPQRKTAKKEGRIPHSPKGRISPRFQSLVQFCPAQSMTPVCRHSQLSARGQT